MGDLHTWFVCTVFFVADFYIAGWVLSKGLH